MTEMTLNRPDTINRGTLTRVAIVEDQRAVSEMIAQIIATDARWEVVLEVSDGSLAPEQIVQKTPDLVILDVMLSGLNGVEILRRISRELKAVRVLVFSGYRNPHILRDLLEAGAHGFVEKSSPLAELRRGMEEVAAGGTYFSQSLSDTLREVLLAPRSGPNRSGLSILTAREREVLQLIAESYSTREIAAKLAISVKTAENHRTNLMKKLDLHDVAGLTRFAVQQGLIDLN